MTLFISDLDGTLLNSEGVLDAYTRDTMNTLIACGLRFTVATARTEVSTRVILDGLKLDLPLILMNGVLEYDMSRQAYTGRETIGAAAAVRVADIMQAHGAPGFLYTLRDGELTTYYQSLDSQHMRQFYEERRQKYNKRFLRVRHLRDIADDDTIYFALLGEHDVLAAVYDELRALRDARAFMYQDTYGLRPWIVEVCSAAASKRDAAVKMKDRGGYSTLVGFGDNLNDLPLFEACDACYAVANAKDEVKKAANAVIGSNDDNGVVRWLLANAMP